MTEKRPDPDFVQRLAADPRASVWVAASAGSGKTKVLTDRVLALLVEGARPDGLLCVTYTKAAAAEMANRIHKRLSDWTQLPDHKLRDEIRHLYGGSVGDDKLAHARTLFATILDLPGGLRIRTIHSFCQSVLGRFPLEARISPNFQAMDEREAAEAMGLARDTVLTAAQSGASALAEALTAVTVRVQEDQFARLMAALSSNRKELGEALQQPGGLDAAVTRLYAALSAEPGVTEEAVIAQACRAGPEAGAADEAGLRHAVEAMVGFGSQPNKDKAKIIEAWLNGGPGTRAATFGQYFSAFITAKGTPNTKMFVNKVAENSAATPDIIAAEQDRLLQVDSRLRRQGTALASEALLRLGEAVLRAYEQRKRATAQLDYDDLIHKTAELLSADRVPWVLFKLDGGLEHLLIDEAQDTSPDQRAIVDALIAEFFAGSGSHSDRRTLFVVGDAKQSIYSFQGADPEGYRDWRRHLDDRANAGGVVDGIRPVDMQVSFRSVQAVLDAVDATFAEPPASVGVTDPDAPAIKHFAAPKKAGLQGRVELWSPTVPPDRVEADLFAPPGEADAIAEADATQRLAEGLAVTVAKWIREERLPASNRPIRAGDILFLVQRRTPLIDALVRELTARHIPVAGVDRLTLTEQIAVMDMLALARALLLPQDDLTFACVLKSPFVGMDDDDLFALAYDRKGESLWQRLEKLRGTNPLFEAAAAWFGTLLAETDRLPPYELFQRALIRRCPGPLKTAAEAGTLTGRQALVARLGREIEDPLEEFLSLSLDYDRRHVPSLEGFLAWFAGGNTQLKRDLETEARDEIRIMTAHGAKGLQAPIVILPDALSKSGAQSLSLRWIDDGAATGLPVWTPSARYEEPIAAELKEAARAAEEREYRRLLYVALTRAEERLVVTGRLRRQKPPEGTWYDLVERGFDRLTDVREEPFEPVEGWSGTAKIFETGAPGPEPEAKEGKSSDPDISPDVDLPSWLTTVPGPEPSPPRPLVPSRPDLPEPAVRSPLDGSDPLRFRRGNLIHRLLQTLPDLNAGEWDGAAARYLARPAHGLEPDQQTALAEETLRLLRHPDFAPLFGPGSRAEVPLGGLVERPDGSVQSLSGQVDRLLISDHEILVVDYKTLRPAPQDPARVPKAYLAQMAGYRAILQKIFPEREIHCAVIFTETPSLVSLPDGLLDGYA